MSDIKTEQSATKKPFAKQPLRKRTGLRLFRHYFWLATAVAFLIPTLFWVADNSYVTSFAFDLAVGTINLIVVATAVHFAIWSVFGNGGFIKRTAIAFVFSLTVLAGLIVGLRLLTIYSPDDRSLVTRQILLLALPIALAAQVPYWFFRGIFGWQIVHGNNQPVGVTLKQLFIIVSMFGIAFSVPAIASNLAAADINIGETHQNFAVLPDGTLNGYPIEVTAQNIAQIRANQIQQSHKRMNSFLLTSAITFAIFSLLSIPVTWFVFRLNRRRAVLWTALYGFLLFQIGGMIFLATEGFDIFLDSTAMILSCNVAVGAILIAFPLFFSKANGFRLVTTRVRSTISPAESRPVVDPLA